MSESKDPLSLDDAALDEYLRRESSVSRQYRSLPDDMPPPALDQQVLAQARAALGQEAAPAVRRPRWIRWGAPLAVAASAVLALSIVMQGGVQEAALMRSTLPPEPVAQQPAGVAAETEAAADVEQAPVVEPDVADLSVLPPTPAESSIPAPGAPQVQSATSARAADQRREIPAVQGRVQQQALSKSADEAASVLKGAEAEPARAENSLRRMRPAAQAAAPAPPPPAAATSSAPPMPEEWLSEIRRLRLEGDVADADREWRRFRETFPDYAVTDADPARPEGCRGGC